MTPERWRRIEELFHAAHAKSQDQRAAFLVEACQGDEALRRQVESLLNESESDDGFLAEPPLVLPADMLRELAPANMAGRSVAGYQLQTLLGAGGMGEVYRARDPKLGRDVAIKILPRAFTSDPDRLARFEREARMLAALNHPNICGIYGLEEAEGIRFLILELVEGETLAEKLAHPSKMHANGEGLPVGQALLIARQIAEALEVAHDKGIIHRDLKPANVKITPDGVVKVLDFGLAKSIGAEGTSPGLTHSPEPTRGGARQGAIIGTAAYMSPEQARGLPVDKRTDIWAFGCVLYEMVTGRVAFGGDTVSDSIAKTLEREPEWSALPPATPAPVRRLLLRALAKDPKKRLRDIGDVRIEIDTIDELLPVTSGATEASTNVAAKTRTAWVPWAVVVALAAGIVIWEAGRGAISETNPQAAVIPEDPLAGAVFTQLTDWPGTEEGAEISPDGKSVAFLADSAGEFDLWRTQVGTDEFDNLTQDIPPLEAPGILRTSGFSSDGAQLWFGGLRPIMLMSQSGGTPRRFLGESARTPAWSSDGRRLVYFTATSGGDPLYVADATGADARQISVEVSHAKGSGGAANPIHNHNPVWSTDGQWIYFIRGLVHNWNHATDEMDIWRLRPSGGVPEQMTHLNTAMTFLSALDERTLLYVARAEDGSGPWLWSFDVVTKVRRRVQSGLEQYTSVSVSRGGRDIALTRARPTASLWTVPILPGRAADRDAQPYEVQTREALAPRFGGGASLFYLSGRGLGDGLWRFQDGKSFEVLKSTDGPLFDPPAPSPDGRRVAVVRKRDGKHRLTVMWANGTEPRTLAPSIDIQGTADWSPTRNVIVVGGKDAEGHQGLFTVAVDGDGEPVRIVDGEALNPVWSPDGTLIVYGGSFAAGQVSLFGVRPDRSAVQLPPVRARPGGYRFLRKRSALVYLERPESVDFFMIDLTTAKTRQLTALSNKGTIRGFDITPDGKHIVFDCVRQNSDIVLIRLPEK